MTAAGNIKPHALRIPPSTWIVVAFSLSVLYFLFGMIDCARGFMMKTIAIEHLEKVLQTSSIDAVEETLAYLTKTRGQMALFGIFTESSARSEQRETILDVALDLRNALIAEERAQTRIAIADINHAFLNKNSFTGGLNEELVNIQRLLGENLREHQRTASEISKTISKQKKMKEEISLLRTRYDLVEGDLNELFSLNLKVHDDHDAIAFYSSGVLEGMPKMGGLPDGLKDLVQLRDALEKSGGKVRIEGENAHVIFAEKLAQIKQLSGELSIAFRGLAEQEEKYNVALQELKNERLERRKRLILTLNHLILLLAAE